MRTGHYPIIVFCRLLIVMLVHHVGDEARYRRGWGIATIQGLEGNNLENKTKYESKKTCLCAMQ